MSVLIESCHRSPDVVAMPIEYHRRDLIATGGAVIIILVVFIPSIVVYFYNLKDASSSTVEMEAQRLDPWYREAQNSLKENLRQIEVLNKPAKNIIFFLGDGMGISSLTAARSEYKFFSAHSLLVVML